MKLKAEVGGMEGALTAVWRGAQGAVLFAPGQALVISLLYSELSFHIDQLKKGKNKKSHVFGALWKALCHFYFNNGPWL